MFLHWQTTHHKAWHNRHQITYPTQHWSWRSLFQRHIRTCPSAKVWKEINHYIRPVYQCFRPSKLKNQISRRRVHLYRYFTIISFSKKYGFTAIRSFIQSTITCLLARIPDANGLSATLRTNSSLLVELQPQSGRNVAVFAWSSPIARFLVRTSKQLPVVLWFKCRCTLYALGDLFEECADRLYFQALNCRLSKI